MINDNQRRLTDEQLAKLNHAEWLEEASRVLFLTSGEMTPFKQGMITRLQWAADYIRLLERRLQPPPEAAQTAQGLHEDHGPLRGPTTHEEDTY